MISDSPKRVLVHLTWSVPALLHGLRAYARDANWQMVSTFVGSPPPKKSREFDGMIALIGQRESFDVRKKFPITKIVDIVGNPAVKADAIVTIDHAAVGRMAADYLYGLGYRRFLGLILESCLTGVSERSLAYRQALLDRGMQPHLLAYDEWVPNSSSHPRFIKKKLNEAIQQVGKPVAIFCPDDYLADLCLQGTLELGYRVPEDVAVLGANNDRGFCEMSFVPLSSIDVNLSTLGYEAARLLDRLMEGDKKAPREIKIQPQRVERRLSTERTSSDDKVVNAILEYIREHFAEKICAEQIIQDVHASRTNAFVRFRKKMGRSIGEEIERVRLENAQNLLVTTNYKVDVVARLSGYLNTSAFCRVFKKVVGQTPSDFKKVSKN